MVADQHGVTVHTRPTNAAARELLENGQALPKPELLKNKSISKIDTYIGASGDDIGKVGHFEPTLPKQGGMSDDLFTKVQERHAQRLQEFKNQGAYLADHADEVAVKNGLIIDNKTGKPFTGDVDGFSIRGMHGETLPKSVVDQVQRDLQHGVGGVRKITNAPSNVKHGVHTEWDYSKLSRTPQAGGGESKFDIAKSIDAKIRGSHAEIVDVLDDAGNVVGQKSGEALVTFSGQSGTRPAGPTSSWWAGGKENPLVTGAR